MTTKREVYVAHLEKEVEWVRNQRDRALQLLQQEHDAHHANCCVSDDDLCHIGQLLHEVQG